MTDEPLDLDAEKWKKLFFDPAYGGNRSLRETVEGWVESHRRVFQYVNRLVPSADQYEVERESIEEGGKEWVSSIEGLRYKLPFLLRLHLAEDLAPQNQSKFLEGIRALGLEDPDIENAPREVLKTEWYAEKYSHLLASHYIADLQISKAIGRGGRV